MFSQFLNSLPYPAAIRHALLLIRYGMVQLLTYGIDMGTFLLLHTLADWPIIYATTLSRVLAGIFSFFSHKYFTFSHKTSANTRREALKFFFFLFALTPLAAYLVLVMSRIIDNVALAKFLADLIGMTISFALTRWVVFRR